MDTMRHVLRCKIHRATVTRAETDYEECIILPPDLLSEAGLVEYEVVQVRNVTQGTRFETFCVRGLVGSRDISVNGAAARLVEPGELVIIAAFMHIPGAALAGYKPRLVSVDQHNRIVSRGSEHAGAHGKRRPAKRFSIASMG